MWENKTKATALTPTLRTKIPTEILRGRILTPDGSQILVGSSESLVLIYQAQSTEWVNKTKTLLA